MQVRWYAEAHFAGVELSPMLACAAPVVPVGDVWVFEPQDGRVPSLNESGRGRCSRGVVTVIGGFGVVGVGVDQE
jgi:hypothetical protein